MRKKQSKRNNYTKVVNERYTLSAKKGGGVIKIEAWEDQEGNLIKYSIAYINHALYKNDNGRVIGYYNSHNYHHKHYFGEVSAVDDFVS